MERPSASFCNGKYSKLDDFCYAEFLAHDILEKKPSKNDEYQPDELQPNDNLIENNHEECSYPPNIKLIVSVETMYCRKVRRILQYHVPNKILFPEKISHHVMLSFSLFREGK